MSVLATKIPKYLRQLAVVYEKHLDKFKCEVITQGRWFVRQETHWDNLDGGMHGHTVVLFAPLESLATIRPAKQRQFAREIRTDLAELNSVTDEFIGEVVIEAEDDEDPECQTATPFTERPAVDPESVGIWKHGLARIFISHRDKHKAKVKDLADALETYGMACFVAHETIPADEEWQKTILKGLETMEVMIAVITDDFSDSVYCMQEVGFALGRSVPVISLKVGASDPVGFTSHKQAQRGSLDAPLKAAKNLFQLIGDRLRRLDRLTDVLVASFCDAQDWHDARDRFDRLKSHVKSLNSSQVDQIVAAYAANDQLHNAIYLDNQANRLVKYMNSATDGIWKIEGNALKNTLISNSYDDLDEDIPF